MNRLARSAVLTLVYAGFCLAQEQGAIEGTVTDTAGEPIAEASVQTIEHALGDVADSTGFYQILAPAGRYTLRASRIGYKAVVLDSVPVSAGQTTQIHFELAQTVVPLKGVQVQAEREWHKYLTEASLIDVHKMKARDISAVPGAFDDPVRAVQIFSGVSGGGDYSSFLAVRGGSPDQNQVIVDGVVIPNPYRFRLAFGGGFSMVNPNTAENVYLHLGGFSAEYGNSLSSILEVESRAGDRERLRVQGSLNLTDVSGIVEGPFITDKAGFLFSVRRTYYDLLINQFAKEKDSAYPFFQEFTGRLSFDPGNQDKLLLGYSRSSEGASLINELSDELGLEEDASSDVISLTWRRMVDDKWRFNTMLSYYHDNTSYRAFEPDSTRQNEREFESLRSEEKRFTIKHDTRLKTGAETWLTGGISIDFIWAKLGFRSGDIGLLYARTESPNKVNFDRGYRNYATYLEASSKATERLHLRVGARYNYATLIDEGELSPRLSMWYELDERTKLEGSWGIFYQYPNPMSLYSRNIPVDLSRNPEVLSAERATHQMIGLERSLAADYSARAQFYYKEIDRLLLPQNDVDLTPRNDGRGLAYGLEFILQKKPKAGARLSGLLSYAFGNARFRSESDGADEWTRFKYDRRHAVTLLGNLRLFGNWNLSTLAQLATGLPYTDVTGIQLRYSGFFARWEFERGARFGAELPLFKKVDVRLSYRPHGRSNFEFYLDIINLTDERNIYEITWEKHRSPENDREEAVKRNIFMLPRIPSFGLSFRL